MRVVRIATIPFVVLHHLESQIRAAVEAGHEVFIVTGPGQGDDQLASLGVAGVVLLEIPREIAPLADLVALFRLYRALGRLKPDLVHSITPKAGLIAAIAGWLCGVGVRIHTFTGQAWAERGGLVRSLSRLSDKVILKLNTRCYADSFSQRKFLVDERIATPDSLQVLGAGSLAGVDLQRFDPVRLRGPAADARAALGIPAGARVIVFLGRVTRDKGIGELVSAFKRLRGAALVLVGPQEPARDPLPLETVEEMRRNPGIHAIGYQAAPERYLAMADVLCLPSYREGFGIVVIEAAALGVPCVGTQIVGLGDAVVDGETGLLVPPKDAEALARALATLLGDDVRRAAFGAAARTRVLAEFDASVLNRKLLQEYAALLERAQPRP